MTPRERLKGEIVREWDERTFCPLIRTESLVLGTGSLVVGMSGALEGTPDAVEGSSDAEERTFCLHERTESPLGREKRWFASAAVLEAAGA